MDYFVYDGGGNRVEATVGRSVSGVGSPLLPPAHRVWPFDQTQDANICP
jgi:hypothetical protein